jgi:hypothetical protein
MLTCRNSNIYPDLTLQKGVQYRQICGFALFGAISSFLEFPLHPAGHACIVRPSAIHG